VTRSHPAIGVIVASLFAAACATYTPSQLRTQPATAQVAEGFAVARDELVRELVEFAATSDIYPLEKVNSRIGIVSLRFIPAAPRDYVDCGEFTRPWIPFKYHSYSGPYKDFLLAKLDASLVVRLVVALSEISPEEARVTVSGRFELQSRQESSFVWTRGRIVTWQFTSGGPATKHLLRPAWGSGAARTCKSTLKAELGLLSLIGRLAN
jgi:hypothetical protein